jgi:hypothetical protein
MASNPLILLTLVLLLAQGGTARRLSENLVIPKPGPSLSNVSQGLLQAAHCADIFKEGPVDILEKVGDVALKVMNYVPGLDTVASVLSDLRDLFPPSDSTHSNMKSAFECLSEFVQASIQKAISKQDLNQITSKMQHIASKSNRLLNDLKKYYQVNRTPNASDYDIMWGAFDFIGHRTDELAEYIILKNGGAVDKAGVLTTFVSFITTQYMAYYKIRSVTLIC